MARSSLRFALINCDRHLACRTLSTAQALIAGLPRATATTIDVSSAAELDFLIRHHNIVISLVPYMYHALIIKVAIKNKVNVVTTSYVSDAVRELDAPAKEAGITVLNEVGVDPGVDHLYAIKKIEEVHSRGGKVRISELSVYCKGPAAISYQNLVQVKKFYSYCGGLSARE